jgi:N,N-dimethylformamidase beta subunit-like protein/concanavalin A-like lectin/glucanase superfamily protein
MALEPLTAIVPAGIHAYAEKSIPAGQTLNVRVSADQAYRVSIFRLGQNVDGPDADIQVFQPVMLNAQTQAITPGSYVNIDQQLPPDAPLAALTLECWVRSFDNTGRAQGLISQHTYPTNCGFGLFLQLGQVAMYLGDGGAFNAAGFLTVEAPASGTWHHIVGTWDGNIMSLFVDGNLSGQLNFAGALLPGNAPLRLAAFGENGVTGNILEGDLAMPVIYGRALSASEIQARFAAQALTPPQIDAQLFGCWPMSEEQGSTIADISLNDRNGAIINRATWMIGGPSYDATVPPPPNYVPANDPSRGHALRFASDDMYDCCWSVSQSFQIPSTEQQGIHVARIEFGAAFDQLYDVTFVVGRAAGSSAAPILVLCSASTWLAYNSTPFAPNQIPAQAWPTGGFTDPNNPNIPGYGCYLSRANGTAAYQMGVNVPWPVAGPYVEYDVGPNYSHLVRAERFLHVWLDQNGHSYDVAADFDLVTNPTLLNGYNTVIIAGHSEYWTSQGYAALQAYLGNGGNVLVLSGNTMFWRVAFSADGAVMECRKMGPVVLSDNNVPPGEAFYSVDGKQGGLMRQCGLPCSQLFGMEPVGFTDLLAGQSFTCRAADHFLFNTPVSAGATNGAQFAAGAIGHEWDIRIDDPQQASGSPPLAGAVTLADCQALDNGEETICDYAMNIPPLNIPASGLTICETIYWEPPAGGRIFYAGSIGVASALASDATLATLVSNALSHFLAVEVADEAAAQA